MGVKWRMCPHSRIISFFLSLLYSCRFIWTLPSVNLEKKNPHSPSQTGPHLSCSEIHNKVTFQDPALHFILSRWNFVSLHSAPEEDRVREEDPPLLRLAERPANQVEDEIFQVSNILSPNYQSPAFPCDTSPWSCVACLVSFIVGFFMLTNINCYCAVYVCLFLYCRCSSWSLFLGKGYHFRLSL